MGLFYKPTTKTARMVATRDQIDAGGAAGRLEICTAGYAQVLISITLGYPGNATGIVGGPTLTLSGFPRSALAIAPGLAAVARIRTSAGVDVITGLTCGVTDGDVQLNNLSMVGGELITIDTAVFTHAEGTNAAQVALKSYAPVTNGSLTAFASAIGLSAAPANSWIDTRIMPGNVWAVRSMIVGARDATREEVEPGPADVGNYSATAFDTLVNSCGAAWFPTKKQFVWFGGGHGGWPGNEVYWVDLPTMAWGRMTDPSPMERWPEGPQSWSWRTTDNTPRANHTYNGIVAIESMDAFFVVTGSPWPEGGFPQQDIWRFHIPTKTWTLMLEDAWDSFNEFRGPEAHYVASEGKIAIGQPNYWRWYDPVANTLGDRLSSQSTMSNGNSVNTPDAIFTFGRTGSTVSIHKMLHANIGTSPSVNQSAACPRIHAHPRFRDACFEWNSFFWDATRNMVISWSASYNSEPSTNRKDVGRFVYAIDFANDHLYEFVLSGGTWALSISLGSYTKWQHLTDLDCYVGMNHTAENQGWMVFKPGTMTRLT